MSMVRFLGLFSVVVFMASCGQDCWAEQKKVLIVDSYHVGNKWSDAEIAGARGVLKGKVDYKVIHMDTKRNGSEEFKRAAGYTVKTVIDTWKPDVVITADDNAVKYVYVPFYKESTVPFVSCGVNWNFSKYGIPGSNSTGIEEVSVVSAFLNQIRKYAKGTCAGFLGLNSETDHIESEEIAKRGGITFSEIKLVNDFAEWKVAFLALQGKVNYLVCQTNAGIKGWDDGEAIKFVRENTMVPTGSAHDFMAPFVFTCYAKVGEEQGQVAAKMAMEIVNGKPVKDIAPTVNKKGQIYYNLAIARKLGIQLSPETLKGANVVKD